MLMSFCRECGTQLADSAIFCSNCGTRVQPAAEENEIPVYSQPVDPAPEEPAPAEVAAACQEPVYEAPVQEEPVYQAPVQEEPVYYPPVYQEAPEFTYTPPAEVPQKPEKVRRFPKKPRSILKTVLVVLLCVLTFIFSTATVMSLCLRSTITAENVIELIRSVELDEIEADTIITDEDTEGDLIDWLRGELVKRGGVWEKLSAKELEEYVETTVRPFLEEEVEEFVEALITGKGDAEITTEEIRELLLDSTDVLEDYGVELSVEDVDNLVSWVDSFGISDYASTKYLEKEYGEILDVVRLALSWLAVAVFGALTLLFLVLIWVTNKCWIRNLNTTGILAVAVGGMFGSFTLIDLLAPNLLLTICGGIDLLYTLVSLVISSGTIVILSVLGAGVVLLLIKALLSSIKVRKK